MPQRSDQIMMTLDLWPLTLRSI